MKLDNFGTTIMKLLEMVSRNQVSRTDVAKNNLKILKKGILVIDDEKSVKIEPKTKKALEDVVITNLEGLTNNSKLDGNGTSAVSFNWESIHENLASRHFNDSDSLKDCTYVQIISKKDIDVLKDMTSDNAIGSLLRTSNLPDIMNVVGEKWEKLMADNKDNSSTYVIYIPGIFTYMRELGKTVTNYTNLLIVAVPPVKLLKDGIEKITPKEATSMIVSDTLKAAAYVGAKEVCIDPFSYKYLKKHIEDALDAYSVGCHHDTYLNTVSKTTFCIPNDRIHIAAKNLWNKDMEVTIF